MNRCLQLARLGAGHVAPNPIVGSVLVYEDRIIGEGYHQEYGKAHAEVNCISSVRDENKELIEKSVIYVSLEPCAHFGKTPPCADLIIKHKIKVVVVGCRDPFEQVDGKGIEKLENAGITVIKGVLENDCKDLNKRFFTFHTKKRPYIILKWAQSKNHKIANADFSRVLNSNAYSNRLVHKWRSEEACIMV
ncbi:MAG: diaminohydroxyphosphoribosylaminopyrimidine deaminase [Segetibacter sp.]|nr:diaminohydroxyphosphoribosylaminopyrimidine deaminase [Segetibacter sp.]